ncbi:hypothetical protein LOY94_000036 [Ophidiomyces ophidiicola]|nr:hypothetical protein LOY94_000036 [Ophidiomyces ophidiicola]
MSWQSVSNSKLLQPPLSPTDKRAPVERLPVELIQKIFFYSLEFNFPRASFHIATALSNEIIYTWLVRLVFSSNNASSNSGIFVRPFLPMNQFSLDMNKRAELQTELLRCRWCTITLMRRCQREYVEHVLRQKCGNLIMSDGDRARLYALDDYWKHVGQYDHTPRGRRGKGDLVLTARNPHSDVTLKIAIWFNSGSVQIREPSPVVVQDTDVFLLPSCSITDPCRMPDRLLQPPWTKENLELLQLLSNEAYIDEDNNFERSKMVLRQLIIDRDIDTFKYILLLHVRVKVYAYPLRWPVRPNHFRSAARYAESENDDPFLKVLFSERRDDISSTDKSIRALLSRYDRSL